jgi:hypothetical protein
MQRRVTFMLAGNTREQLVLQPGDVVQGATLAQVPTIDKRAYERMEQRHAKEHPNERVVWVHAHGVVRALVANVDCVPSRRPATVSL